MFRLDQEKDQCAFYFWLTLQYDDDHVPKIASNYFEGEEMCFSKEHCHFFFEKLRKRYKEQGCTFKHFLVCEYGPNATHRPHYHCLLMVYNNHDLAKNYLIRKEMQDFIRNKAWPHGFVCEKTFHGRVLSYLTKYCLKPELLGEKHTMKPFTLISKGIGLCLLDKIPSKQLNQMRDNLDFTYWYNGSKIQLPRYYVDKILPHSMQNLHDLMPSDPLGSWDDYENLSKIRQKLQDKNYNLGLQHAKRRIWKESFKEKSDRIDYELSTFRSKQKTRKNL